MFLVDLCLFLQRQLYCICHFFLTYFESEKPPCIPRIKDPLLELSAVTLAKKIREREISSLTVVKAYIDRINEVNPYLNAMVEDRFEEAIADAKECDEKLKSGQVTSSTLEKEKPFYGVPFTVKESCGLKGYGQTGFAWLTQSRKAPEDGGMVQVLRKAGAIPVCVTNTPEMCSGIESTNLIRGRTLNPYDRRYTAGGSSGGEGALIGAGASLMGVGSDIAGSIRIPAHFNGIFGHKPTPGIIPMSGHFPSQDNEIFLRRLVTGTLARYAEDLWMTIKAASFNCSRDLRLDEPVDLKNVRVYYIEDFGGNRVVSPTKEIQNCVMQAANNLARKGCRVQRLNPELLKNVLEIMLGVFFSTVEVPKTLPDPNNPKQEKNALCEFVKAVFGLSRHTKTLIYNKMQMNILTAILASNAAEYGVKTEKIGRTITDLLGEDGVILCPTFPITTAQPLLISLQLDSAVYSIVANTLELPATHVPLGLSKNGLPLGCQVMAAPYQDRLCLSIAKTLESIYGGWKPPQMS
ncbi:hypothetical protein KM043_009039 [Ampulex compressa]|nr:hypothetical protein KM043_009039 [Ampulex compressa]